MVVWLSACAPPPIAVPTAAPAPTEQRPAPSPTPIVTRIATLAPKTTPERAIVDSLSEEGRRWVTQARQDLIGRLNVASDKISLVKAEAVQWPDSSLGCPEPGMMYAQVITPGYRVVLDYAGKEYEYHAGNNRVTLCEPKQ
jgi:hypothetical protein